MNNQTPSVRTKNQPSPPGFTRIESVIVVATLALLSAVAFPVLAGSKARSGQAICFNNLRRIGQAFHLWANDHRDRNPWVTSVTEGGTFGSTDPLKGNAWFQMGWISNQLVNPRVLVCPSDQGVGAPRKIATEFSTDPKSGFFNPGFRNAAISYTIGLHSFAGVSDAILSGDRNIRWDALNVGCSYGVLFAQAIADQSNAMWTNAIHREAGNLLFNHGGVEELSSAGLQRALADRKASSSGVHHFLTPD